MGRGKSIPAEGAAWAKTWRRWEAKVQSVFYSVKYTARVRSRGRTAKKVVFKPGRTPKSRLRDEISSGSCDKSLDVFSKYFTGSECSFALDAEKRKLKGIHLEGGCTVVNCSQVQLL